MADLTATRVRLRPSTVVVPKHGGRVRPRLWRLDWLRLVAESPFYVQDGKFLLKSTGRPPEYGARGGGEPA